MACSGASPNWTAASASRADVNDCLPAVNASFNYGDTVNVPAGSVIWSSGVTMTKGGHLKGAGKSSTIITASGGITPITIAPNSTARSNETVSEVSGFTLDGGCTGSGSCTGASLHLIQVNGADGVAAKPYRSIKIHDNKFQNNNGVQSDNGCINVDGQARGVVYSNEFDRINVVCKWMGNDTIPVGGCDQPVDWKNSAYYPFAYGIAGDGDNLFFEDNTIYYSSTSGVSTPGWTETGHGSRSVIRYNSWDLTNANPDELWDVHGCQNFGPVCQGGQSASMISEYYGNTLISSGLARWMYMRGGWLLMFNNHHSDAGDPDVHMGIYDDGCDNDVWTVPASNPKTEIDNTYVWNNDANGSEKAPIKFVTGTISNSCPPDSDVDWWKFNAGCSGSGSCTSGIGKGTSNPTGTCTDGVGFWVASDTSRLTIGANATGAAATARSVNQAGHLWKCVSGTWTDYYQPYTYPHPLRDDAESSSSIGTLTLSRRVMSIVWIFLGLTGASIFMS